MIRMCVLLSAALVALIDRLDSRKDRGATAVEYGLIVGLLAAAAVAAIALATSEATIADVPFFPEV